MISEVGMKIVDVILEFCDDENSQELKLIDKDGGLLMIVGDNNWDKLFANASRRKSNYYKIPIGDKE